MVRAVEQYPLGKQWRRHGSGGLGSVKKMISGHENIGSAVSENEGILLNIGGRGRMRTIAKKETKGKTSRKRIGGCSSQRCPW